MAHDLHATGFWLAVLVSCASTSGVTTSTGYCGTHPKTDKRDACPKGGASGFGAAESGVTTMEQCALKCLRICKRCKFAVFSKDLDDCTLYSACDTTMLAQYKDYRTAHVEGTTEDDWGGAAAALPLEPLVIPVHVAHLRGGRLAAIPIDAAPLLLEIGSSDRNTADVELLPVLESSFLVTAEPLLDKYARAIGRRTTADQARERFEPLSQHHRRGIVLPIAVGPAPPEGEARAFKVGGTAGCSSLLNSSKHGSYGRWCDRVSEVRRVWTFPLATVLGWMGRPVDFVKIDAQGADLMIVQSGGTMLHHVRAVQLEVVSDDCSEIYDGQPRCTQVVAEMAALGFMALSPVLCTPIGVRARHGASCESELVFVAQKQRATPHRQHQHQGLKHRDVPALGAQPDYVLSAHQPLHNGCNRTHQPEEVEELLAAGQVVAVVHNGGKLSAARCGRVLRSLLAAECIAARNAALIKPHVAEPL
eukprot:CAMPEP_0119359250 /NCGR_PEP_ID=MMETSP1334-20130426/7183_1 /TAXON_ID=127549 /ORGANISM="Calcidiscus leptoporus, Strain RCC1130" /LENGTH=475 /DNA_ID=CAMNT_0007373889 /DNA_START=26 /DNA_END=1454 /DNA_ORIENTATION=-